MTGGHWGHHERKPDVAYDSTQDPVEILSSGAAAAGLTDQIRPFAREGSLAERFAANPFLMAPMAGVSDQAYRSMARAGGAALAYTEMVSVAGLHYGGEKTWDLVVPCVLEPDIAVQLFGSKSEQFREAACLVAERIGASAADIERLILPDTERYADHFRDFRLDASKARAAGIELGTFAQDVDRCLADFGY